MLFARKPDPYKGKDAIYLGRVSDDDGYIDTTNEIEGLHGPVRLYLSIAGLRNIASHFPQVGLVDAAKYDALARELDAAHQEAEAFREHNAELEAKFERINGLQKDGFKVVRQQGRPPVKR